MKLYTGLSQLFLPFLCPVLNWVQYTFQLTELKDKIVSIEPFKESILKFKLNHNAMTEPELKDWLKANVERIILDQDIIKMDVKKRLFRLE